MPRNHKPSKVSQALKRRNGGGRRRLGDGHRCPKSPSGSHWWVIEAPGRATSDGVCRYCGEQRRFANTIEASFTMVVGR